MYPPLAILYFNIDYYPLWEEILMCHAITLDHIQFIPYGNIFAQDMFVCVRADLSF